MATYVDASSGTALIVPAATVGGGASSGKIPQLDNNGRFPSTMMPSGVGVDATPVTASEALAAGDFVNIYNNAGTANVRKADGSSNKPAHGYVLANVASGAAATVYFDDLNDQVTGATAGDVFLSATTAGKTSTVVPSAAGQIIQKVGVAISATAIHVKLEQFYLLS